MNAYAGIGGRQAPPSMLKLCTEIAGHLRTQGWTLRTGHAIGCDQAFEAGAREVKEVFLPWRDYEIQKGTFLDISGDVCPIPTAQALEMAASLHPTPDRLSMAALRLHARNCHILLGYTLNDPVAAVICWTENEERGGTAFGIRVAREHSIPVKNLASREVREEWEQAICGHVTVRLG